MITVHLVDGTYELFRNFFAVPPRTAPDGSEVGAVGGVVASMLRLVIGGATHVGVATDHVIESFRNDLFDGYKRGDGIEPALRSQFEPLEDALTAFGFTVWPMIEWEADDALAAAAKVAAEDERVERILICTPDKDLSQCVRGDRVVQFDRRREELRDEAGVIERFGVRPEQIPAYLALVGDSADGIPGIPGFGAKSASIVLQHFGELEQIDPDPGTWPKVRSAPRLATTLQERMTDAVLYRRLATLRDDAPVGTLDDWRWQGVSENAAMFATEKLDDPGLLELAEKAEAAIGR
ncbi:MAG: 5'-3' exonuclease H3TH domain-containing protein [Actinomycetota bacterium]